MSAADPDEGRRVLVATGAAAADVADVPTLVRVLLDADPAREARVVGVGHRPRAMSVTRLP